jgi:hypothetical protein
MPEGIRIGSGFNAVKRVYPRLLRSDEGARIWHVLPYYTFPGARYDLWLNLDRGLRDLTHARVEEISVDWYGAAGGKATPPLTFTGLGGAAVSQASTPFDANCSIEGCGARARDWVVDVTLAFTTTATGVEVRAQTPAANRALDGPGPRYRFP